MPKITGIRNRVHRPLEAVEAHWVSACRTERWHRMYWKRKSVERSLESLGRHVMTSFGGVDGVGGRRWDVDSREVLSENLGCVQFNTAAAVARQILRWRSRVCGIVPKGDEVIFTACWLAYVDRRRALAGRVARGVDLDALSEMAKAELAMAVLAR